MVKVELICKICGKTYYKPPSQAKNSKYCSKECKNKSQITRITFTCLNCGKQSTEVPSRISKGLGRFCSQKCFHEYKKLHPKPSGEYINCKYCGKEYENIKSRENKSRFCSRKCQNKYLIGENASGWKGGISFEPYCPKFNEEFKERVREFWNRRCGICGKPESKNDQKLSVHHISYNKNDCCHEGEPVFIPTCKSCHIRTNKNRSFWKEILSNYIMIWFNGESYLQKFN